MDFDLPTVPYYACLCVLCTSRANAFSCSRLLSQVRLALAFEELGKLRSAQAAVTRALSLPLTPALAKAASACSRRVNAASEADASVLASSSNSGNTLVRGGDKENENDKGLGELKMNYLQ